MTLQIRKTVFSTILFDLTIVLRLIDGRLQRGRDAVVKQRSCFHVTANRLVPKQIEEQQRIPDVSIKRPF